MKQPCARDCPLRSPVCHASCRRYLLYREELEQQKRASVAAQPIKMYEWERITQRLHTKQRKAKVSGGHKNE